MLGHRVARPILDLHFIFWQVKLVQAPSQSTRDKYWVRVSIQWYPFCKTINTLFYVVQSVYGKTTLGDRHACVIY